MTRPTAVGNRRSDRQRTRRATAFTLIELLVVISIIALLIAVLLPVLANARAVARTAVCAANQRQIAIGGVSYAGDFKNRLPGGGYHQYDNLVGQQNRGNVLYLASEYLRVPVEPSFSPTGAPLPPVAGQSYRIPNRDNVMYCPANDRNLPEPNFPFGSQWYPDYMLRGFGALNANGFGDVIGYPKYDIASMSYQGARKTLLQDMIYLPGTPTIPAFADHYRKFNNHFAGDVPTGGNVTGTDTSVAFIAADQFFTPLDGDRPAAPLGYISVLWGFDLNSSFIPGTLHAGREDGSFEGSTALYSVFGY